jgi:pimeloyl-ACP methyl ester carboxylesterase
MKHLLAVITGLLASALAFAASASTTTSTPPPASTPASASANDIPYGRNDAAGRHQNVGGVSIYYEVYGDDGTKKPPLVLLHGGIYGYIDDFAPQIPELAQHFVVYAIATRGHGRSGVGDQAYTYQLFADDAAAILRRVTVDAAAVVGFSDGGIAALALAGEHPHLVSKVVAIGAGRSADTMTDTGKNFAETLTPEHFARENRAVVERRRPVMSEPERWDEFIEKMGTLYRRRISVSTVTIENIVAPTLLIGGDRDEFFRREAFDELHRLIPKSRLEIVPDCGHVESLKRPDIWKNLIIPFLLETAPPDMEKQYRESD